MTDRDRLIEILKVPIYPKIGVDPAEVVADHLIANGVIVPPCKVGDKLYNADSLIDECCYWEVEVIKVYADGNYIVDDSGNLYSFNDIGKTVFLTKEEAEEKLKELGK